MLHWYGTVLVFKINYVNNVPKYIQASKLDCQHILVWHSRAEM